jgi:hypothetical protein
MTKFIAFFIACFCSISICLGETQDSEATDFLNQVVDSFNNQDCGKYSSYFTESMRQKKRRESGLYFASNDASVSLKESHILSQEEERMEIAVAYLFKVDGQSSDLVSKIFLEKEGSEWKISKEVKIKNKNESDMFIAGPIATASTAAVYASNPFQNQGLPPQPAQQNCSNGKCGGPQAPFASLKACRDYGFDPIPCRNGSCSTR